MLFLTFSTVKFCSSPCHLDDEKIPLNTKRKYKILVRMVKKEESNGYDDVELKKDGLWSPKAVVQQFLLSSQSSKEIFKSGVLSLSSFDAPIIRTIIDEAKHQVGDSNTVDASSFEPLNVIIFYPDDMRYDSLEDVRGPNVVKTPFLSQLAKNGMRFTHNAVTTSICWVSRATLFTGRYASQHGSDRLYCPRFTLHEHWRNTWPSLLQKAGYFVGHIGKW